MLCGCWLAKDGRPLWEILTEMDRGRCCSDGNLRNEQSAFTCNAVNDSMCNFVILSSVSCLSAISDLHCLTKLMCGCNLTTKQLVKFCIVVNKEHSVTKYRFTLYIQSYCI